jgi:hypothetical protein
MTVSLGTLSTPIAATKKLSRWIRRHLVRHFIKKSAANIGEKYGRPAQIVVLAVVGKGTLCFIALTGFSEKIDLILLSEFCKPHINGVIKPDSDIVFANHIIMVDIPVQVTQTPMTIFDWGELVCMPDQVNIQRRHNAAFLRIYVEEHKLPIPRYCFFKAGRSIQSEAPVTCHLGSKTALTKTCGNQVSRKRSCLERHFTVAARYKIGRKTHGSEPCDVKSRFLFASRAAPGDSSGLQKITIADRLR